MPRGIIRDSENGVLLALIKISGSLKIEFRDQTPKRSHRINRKIKRSNNYVLRAEAFNVEVLQSRIAGIISYEMDITVIGVVNQVLIGISAKEVDFGPAQHAKIMQLLE